MLFAVERISYSGNYSQQWCRYCIGLFFHTCSLGMANFSLIFEYKSSPFKSFFSEKSTSFVGWFDCTVTVTLNCPLETLEISREYSPALN